jgi:ABC-type uncharacterized transport system involved in gliding motility auxiliary subunit
MVARRQRFRTMIRLGIGVLTLVSVNYAAFMMNHRWDLTSGKTHTLSAATEQFLSTVEDPLTMTVFYVGLPPKYLEDLLAAYERVSNGQVVAEIVDPLVNLGYAAQFGQRISGEERRVILQQPGGARRDITFTDDVLTENMINNAILQLTRPVRVACFLGGHGEADPFSDKEDGFSLFSKNLIANNVLVERLNLGADDGVPDHCAVLVIAGPMEPLRVKEVEVIQRYLRGGGRAFIMVENIILRESGMPLTSEELDRNPSMNELLEEWGVRVNQDVVVDLTNHAGGDVGSPATKNYMSHRAIVGDLDYTFFIRPRSISIVKDRRKTIKLAPLILTQSEESSWGEKNRHLEIRYEPETDRPGPVPIAFVIYEPGNDQEPGTRLMVITDRDFISNAYINHHSNARLGLNAINWLTEKDYHVFVDEASVKEARLSLTSRQKREVAVILLMAPLGMLLFWIFRVARRD